MEKRIREVEPDSEWEESFKDRIEGMWSFEDLREMTTTDIIAKLRDMNVDFDIKGFKKLVRNYISAMQLAKDVYYTGDIICEGRDEDFVWIAITELWRRLLPNRFNIEMIDEAMQGGYEYIANNDRVEGFNQWFTAWEMVKSVVPSRIKSVEEADSSLFETLSQMLFNWCQDFELELGNAGRDDRFYFKKRKRYCREFYRMFPDSSNSIIINMLRAEAESFALLGRSRVAEKLLETLVNKFPLDAWCYAAWGDLYADTEYYGNHIKADYDRAKQIYRMGLERCDSDKDVLRERLADLRGN